MLKLPAEESQFTITKLQGDFHIMSSDGTKDSGSLQKNIPSLRPTVLPSIDLEQRNSLVKNAFWLEGRDQVEAIDELALSLAFEQTIIEAGFPLDHLEEISLEVGEILMASARSTGIAQTDNMIEGAESSLVSQLINASNSNWTAHRTEPESLEEFVAAGYKSAPSRAPRYAVKSVEVSKFLWKTLGVDPIEFNLPGNKAKLEAFIDIQNAGLSKEKLIELGRLIIDKSISKRDFDREIVKGGGRKPQVKPAKGVCAHIGQRQVLVVNMNSRQAEKILRVLEPIAEIEDAISKKRAIELLETGE